MTQKTQKRLMAAVALLIIFGLVVTIILPLTAVYNS